MKKIEKQFTICGMPWWQALITILLGLGIMFWGLQSGSITNTLAVCFSLAVLLNEIGKRIPIWHEYFGGGLLMCFFGVAIMKYYGWIPAETIDSINEFVSGNTNFMELFVIMLIVGSILSLNRSILLRAFAGYLPAILGGLAAACILGVLGGMAFGIRPADCIVRYVLPIMGGGNGAGAVPMSQIYEQVTGVPAANYYAFAIIILTIANLFSIVGSALLNRLGQKMPGLTGDKKTLLRSGNNFVQEDAAIVPNMEDMGGAMLIALAAYSAGRLMSQKVLPSVAGAAIHQYAYTILFMIALAASGLVPPAVCAAAKRLQIFFQQNLSIVVMVGMGASFDITELFTALTPANIAIALLVVVGAVIGAGGVGYLVGFYPIDSALLAGLCMSNRGGNGDIACLGAADRMGLIAYAQLSSRLGGGIVLIIASIAFRYLL